MDSGSMKDVPLVSGMRQTLEVVGENLGSGGDYLHASLYTHILTRTAKEKLFLQCLHQCRHWRNSVLQRKTMQKSHSYWSSVYIDIGTGLIAFCSAKPCKSYSSIVYIDVEPGRIAFFSAKPCKKLFRGGFCFFLSSLNVSRQLVKAGRRQAALAS